jgi:AcrR family transcriptional regulator
VRGYATRVGVVTDRRTQLLDATIVVIARRGVRGLRVQEVAAEAGVSVPLLYHYFGSREGLLEAALFAVSEHADRYSTSLAAGATSAREELVARLVGELQDTDEVRINSSAWGELRWNSVFEEALRPAVHKLTAEWVDEIAELVEKVGVEEGRGIPLDVHASAERLVALVEGLSGRWLTGAVAIERLRDLLANAIDLELRQGGTSTAGR